MLPCSAQASAGVLSDISAGVVPQVLVFRIALSTLDNFAAVPPPARLPRPLFSATSITAQLPAPFSSLDCGPYEQVLRSMRDVRLAAPYYVITTGPTRGEGFVLARNLTASVHEARLAQLQVCGHWPRVAQGARLLVHDPAACRVRPILAFGASLLAVRPLAARAHGAHAITWVTLDTSSIPADFPPGVLASKLAFPLAVPA